MNNNFNKSLDFILKWEGYKSEDPRDSGGRTIFGIAEKFHPEMVAKLWDMPKEEAEQEARDFYKTEYWDKCDCDNIYSPYDMVVMDTAVNMGISRALGFRKLSMGGAGYPEWVDYIMLRIEFYTKIAKNNPVFLKGWINRVMDLYRAVVKDTEHPLSEYKED